MKLSSRHVVIASSLALCGAGFWVGCGSDSTTPSGGVDAGKPSTDKDSGNPNPTNDDGGTAADAGTNPGTDAGAKDAATGDGAPPANCMAYCTLMQATCVAAGANGQYLDQATCEKMCAKFPAGDAGATGGNSFACRAYHASVASQSAANATTHCPHAGPYGYGGCGSETENFCFMFNAQCAPSDYGVNCPTAFGLVNDTTDGGSFLPGTGPRDCREYHLENAYQANVTTGSHCGHASKDGGGVCQ